MASGTATMEKGVRVREITVPADEGQLGRVRDFIVEVCSDAGMGPRETSNTKLAVDEACTNIIKHAYGGSGSSGEIKVRVEVHAGELTIRLEDHGKRFDFSSVEDPDLDQYVETGRKGGLGVFLINRLMDHVHYESKGNTNQLVLTKRTQSGLSSIAFEQRPIRSTLKFKFTLRAGSGLFLLMVVLWGFIFVRQTRDISAQVTSHWVENRRLAENLANRSVELLLQPDELSVEQTNMTNYLARLQANSDEVAYVRVTSSDGQIVSSGYIDEIFTPYQEPEGEVLLNEDGRTSWKETTWQGRNVRDIRTQVRMANAGNQQVVNLGDVHLGIYEDAVRAGVDDTRWMASLLLLAIFLVGLLLIVGLVQVFVKPIQMLTDGVRAIGDGNLEGQLDVQGPAEIGAIAAVFNEITNKFKVAQNSILEQEKMQKEMEVAKEIQHSLLPRHKPEVSGYDISPLYQAAAEVGGDYYDFVQVDEDTIGVVVADVSGKGVPGSLVMTMIRTALRMEARGNKNASDVMAKMNTFVTDDMKKGMFVTMFYVIVDSKNRTISYSSAGHNPMILFRAETNETFFLNPKGFPVGISLPDEELFRKSITLEKIKLKKDDMLLIYTDGVTEAMNAMRDQYGEERLLRAIKQWGKLSPEEFIEKLDLDIKKFTAGHPQNDDITVVAIKEKLAADDVLFGIRKRLIELVDVKGLSVKEACHQMRVSPATYYRYKRRLGEMGERGLRNDVLRQDVTLNRVSLEARKEILLIMTEHPEFGAKRLSEAYNSNRPEAAHVTERMVYEELKRLSLNTRELRMEYLRRNRLLDEEEAIQRDSRELVEDLLKGIPGVEIQPVSGREQAAPPEREGTTAGAQRDDDELEEVYDFDTRDTIGLSSTTVADITELYVEGHIDSMASASLEQRLRQLIKNGAYKIAVNLSDVSYISSGGWGIFTGEVRHLRENGGDVVLVGMASDVYDVYELLGFADVIRAFATIEEARDYLHKPADERFAAPAQLAPIDTDAIAAEHGVDTEEEPARAGSPSTPQPVYATEWESLKIEATTVGEAADIVVISLQGIIDTVSAENLRSALGNVISRDIFKIVVDMSRVEYVSSGGWGTFTERLRELRRAGGDIKLFGMDPDVYYVFTMLGFNIVLSSFDILTAAIEDFGHGESEKADPEAVGLRGIDPEAEFEAESHRYAVSPPPEIPKLDLEVPAAPTEPVGAGVDDTDFEIDLDVGSPAPPPPAPERPSEPEFETEFDWDFSEAPERPAPEESEDREPDDAVRAAAEHVVAWEEAPGGVRVARLHGPFEAVAVEHLSATLALELPARPPALVFDFGDVPYVSSTGWGQVAGCYQSCQEWGGVVAIFGLNSDLYDIFMCLEFHTFIDVYPNEAEALGAVASSLPAVVESTTPAEVEDKGAVSDDGDEPSSVEEAERGMVAWKAAVPEAPVYEVLDDTEEDVDEQSIPAIEPADHGRTLIPWIEAGDEAPESDELPANEPSEEPAAGEHVDVESAVADKNIGRDRKLREMGWSEYGDRLRRIMEREQRKKEDD